MMAAPPLADHQPLAVPEAGEYRPACLCGWQLPGGTFENRAEAMVWARRHDEEEAEKGRV